MIQFPEEIWQIIFCYIDPCTIGRMFTLSKQFYKKFNLLLDNSTYCKKFNLPLRLSDQAHQSSFSNLLFLQLKQKLRVAKPRTIVAKIGKYIRFALETHPFYQNLYCVMQIFDCNVETFVYKKSSNGPQYTKTLIQQDCYATYYYKQNFQLSSQYGFQCGQDSDNQFYLNIFSLSENCIHTIINFSHENGTLSHYKLQIQDKFIILCLGYLKQDYSIGGVRTQWNLYWGKEEDFAKKNYNSLLDFFWSHCILWNTLFISDNTIAFPTAGKKNWCFHPLLSETPVNYSIETKCDSLVLRIEEKFYLATFTNNYCAFVDPITRQEKSLKYDIGLPSHLKKVEFNIIYSINQVYIQFKYEDALYQKNVSIFSFEKVKWLNWWNNLERDFSIQRCDTICNTNLLSKDFSMAFNSTHVTIESHEIDIYRDIVYKNIEAIWGYDELYYLMQFLPMKNGYVRQLSKDHKIIETRIFEYR